MRHPPASANRGKPPMPPAAEHAKGRLLAEAAFPLPIAADPDMPVAGPQAEVTSNEGTIRTSQAARRDR